MKRKYIDPSDYARMIMKKLPSGILLTTKADETINTMVIGWGTIGVNWGKNVFVAYVRESRFTKALLDKNPEFTVNIPADRIDSNILKIAGSMSGRDLDKIKELNLTPVDSENISVPAIAELPVTLECKVLYAQEQELSEESFDNSLLTKYYPADSNNKRDQHTAFYAEIVNAYILEQE